MNIKNALSKIVISKCWMICLSGKLTIIIHRKLNKLNHDMTVLKKKFSTKEFLSTFKSAFYIQILNFCWIVQNNVGHNPVCALISNWKFKRISRTDIFGRMHSNLSSNLYIDSMNKEQIVYPRVYRKLFEKNNSFL